MTHKLISQATDGSEPLDPMSHQAVDNAADAAGQSMSNLTVGAATTTS